MVGRVDKALDRRDFLAAIGAGVAGSSVSATLAQSDDSQDQVETEEELPKIEAEYIALKAKQRRLVYLNYAQLFSTDQKVEQIATEVLPDLEDFVAATFPGSTLISAYDLQATVNSVREADQLVSILGVLRYVE